jgi:NADP-dependent 3-hydroxy acid dehydrogenase YdfG
MKGLTGKTALITGASSGIGRKKDVILRLTIARVRKKQKKLKRSLCRRLVDKWKNAA